MNPALTDARAADNSFSRSIEDAVDDIERYHATADDRASGHRSPQDIGSRKVPDGQQASNHRHQDAGTRRPERNPGDDPGI